MHLLRPQPALLADSLEVLRLQSWVLGGINLGASWAVRMPASSGWLHLVPAVAQVAIEPEGPGVSASPGDLLIVFPGHAHRLQADTEAAIVPLDELAPRFRRESGTLLPSPAAASGAALICVRFLLDGFERTVLRAALPPCIRVSGNGHAPCPYVRDILGLILRETVTGDPCAQIVINRLVRILLIKAVQQHMSAAEHNGGNWLRAIADPDIGRAIALMHDHPEQAWTVAGLAERVALSRSAFSARFTLLMGKPPLEYLFVWRMQKAAYLLRTTRAELKEIASRVGYESASAFSKAFARWAGTAPGNHRRTARAQAASVAAPPPL